MFDTLGDRLIDGAIVLAIFAGKAAIALRHLTLRSLRNLRFGAAFVQRAFGDLFALGFHAFDHGFEIGRRRYALVLRGSFERGPGAPYQQQGGAGGEASQGKDASRPCPAVIVGAVSGFGIFHRATHYRSIVRERFLT